MNHDQSIRTLRAGCAELFRKGDAEGALRLCEEAAERLRPLGEAHPAAAAARGQRAQALTFAGRHDEAVEEHRACVRAARADGVPRAALGRALLALAQAVHLQRGAEGAGEALALQEEALEACEGSPPAAAAALTATAFTLSKCLGRHERALGLLAEADAILAEAARRGARAAVAGRAKLLGDVGECHTRLRQFDAAREAFEEGARLGREAFGEGAPQVAAVVALHAECEYAAGRFERSAALAAEALRAQRAALGDRHAAVARSMRGAGLALYECDRFGEAAEMLRGALDRGAAAGDAEDAARLEHYLVASLLRCRRVDEARDTLRAAAARRPPPPSAERLEELDLAAMADPAAAAGAAREKLYAEFRVPDPDGTAKERGDSAFLYGLYAEACRAYAEALPALAGAARARVLSNRSAALVRAGRAREALADADACVAADARFVRGQLRRADALEALGRAGEAGEAHKRYGNALLREAAGQEADALAEYDRALALDPGLASAHYNRARMLVRLRLPADAAAAFSRAAELAAEQKDAALAARVREHLARLA